MSNSLGNKIRYFRKRAGLSQLELEIDTNSSSGSISRIENDEVNPNKETIIKIAETLNLNDREKDYLYGITVNAATEKEINTVKEAYKDYFSKKGIFAYIVDDRSRLIFVSETFYKFFNWNKSMDSKILNRSFIAFVLDNELGIRDYIPADQWEGTITNVLKRFVTYTSFMIDDLAYKEAMDAIKSDPLTSEIWAKVSTMNEKEIFTEDSREVVFVYKGKRLKNYYSVDPLPNYHRFMLIQYTPSNLLLRLMQKVL